MAKPGKWFRLVFRDPARRRVWFRRYIHHKNIYCKGESEIGFARHVLGFQSYMVAWLFFRDLIPDLSIWLVVVAFPVLAAVKTAAYYLLGLFWDRHRLFDEEHEWGNARNPMLRSIHKTVAPLKPRAGEE